MRVLAWNTQGAKWDRAFELASESRDFDTVAGQRPDTVVVISEAGWAPWMNSQEVKQNQSYAYSSNDEMMVTGEFLEAAGRGECTGYWLPWVTDPAAVEQGAGSNSRCSLGVIWMPSPQGKGYTVAVRALLQEWEKPDRKSLTSRPVAMVTFSDSESNVRFWIALVHLVSGYA